MYKYHVSDGEFIRLCYPKMIIKPETQPPVINNNIVQTNLATSNGWATQKQITVTGTENYCSGVKITLKDREGNVYLNNAAAKVTNNAWTYTFVPDIEAPETGKEFIITVTDNLGNSAEKSFTIQKTDKKGPTVTSSAKTAETWTKEKAFTFTATDEGSGGIQISINNENNYTVATKTGTTYSRAHTFTEEIYGNKTIKIYYKDGLGNTTVQDFKIYNIDKTKPTITKNEIVNNEIVLTGNDRNETLNAEGSGIAKYRYTGSSEENITIGTTGKESTTNKIPLTEFVKVKYAYIAAIDRAGNISSTVKITLPTYKITINPNGGTWRGQKTNTELTGKQNGQQTTIENPEREGYNFTRWTITTGTIQGTTYTNGIGNATLTANWEAKPYTITYNLEGGTVTGNPTNYTIETQNTTLKNPTKPGHTFQGWTGSNGTTAQKTITIEKGTTGNKTYTANWKKDTYTITYNLEGGTVTGNPTSYQIDTQNKTLNNPEKQGYTFIGWTGSNGTTAQKTITITQGSTGNKTYTANWEAKTDTPYTIKHWKQNLSDETTNNTQNNNPDVIQTDHNGKKYTLVETENLKGTTNNRITPQTKQYEGFIAPEEIGTTIKANGTTEINYYYERRTDLTYTVEYIDKQTGQKIEQTTKTNQTYETEIETQKEIKQIENYEYESKTPETLKIGTGENIIKIYYTKQKGKIIIHHYIYDKETNKKTTSKLIEDETIEGPIGQKHTIKPSNKIPPNYENAKQTPETIETTITKETKEISQYYQLKETRTQETTKTEITTEIPKNQNGNYEIKKGEEIKYKIEYETKIEDYKGNGKIEITSKLPEGIDPEKSDLKGGIYDPETNTVKWEIDIKDIDTFENGNYTEKIEKEITIVYKKDIETKNLENLEIKTEGNTKTYYPENYPDKGGQETPKEEKPEKPIETPEKKQGKITVKYIDIDTNQENTTYAYEITGIIGQEYETEKKEIPYYKYIKSTENTKGKITKESEEVKYYYQKQNFNIGIEKEIESININGQEIKSKNKQTAKIELEKTEINKTNLTIKYNIKIENKGEIDGTAKIEEETPQGYKIIEKPENSKTNENGNVETEIELKAGESKNLELTLKWENTEENLGTKTSTTKIINTKNKANYKDTNEKDNTAKTTIIVNIKTGEIVSNVIIMITVITIGTCILIGISIINRKEPKIKDIKFLK